MFFEVPFSYGDGQGQDQEKNSGMLGKQLHGDAKESQKYDFWHGVFHFGIQAL